MRGGVAHWSGARAWLALLFAFAVVARLCAAWLLGSEVTPWPGIFDQVSYHTLALRVANGHGFTFAAGWWPATPAEAPTAHWSYLYTSLLAGIYTVVGEHALVARVLQAAVTGVLQPLLTYRIASRLFGERAGVASAAIVAGYAYFVYYSAALITESLFIVAVLWSLDAAMRVAGGSGTAPRARGGAWVELGAALAVAVLLRQVMLLVAPLVLGWAAIRVARAGHAGEARRRSPWQGLVLASAVLVVAIAPWTWRNYRAFGEFVPLNTNAGFALFWGNHPVHGSRAKPLLPVGTYAQLIPGELRGLNEASLDRALLRRALATIADDPARYARLSVSRAEEYFRFWPSQGASVLGNGARALSFGVCLPLMLHGVALAARHWRRLPPGTGLLLLVAATYAAIHLLTWALIRYRVPVDAVMMPFAGLSLAHLLAARREHDLDDGLATPAALPGEASR